MTFFSLSRVTPARVILRSSLGWRFVLFWEEAYQVSRFIMRATGYDERWCGSFDTCFSYPSFSFSWLQTSTFQLWFHLLPIFLKTNFLSAPQSLCHFETKTTASARVRTNLEVVVFYSPAFFLTSWKFVFRRWFCHQTRLYFLLHFAPVLWRLCVDP